MPDNNMFGPLLDPAGLQYQIERQQALYQALANQAMTPQQGQMVSGHYIAPAFGGLGAIGQALIAKGLADKIPSERGQLSKTMANNLARMFGGDQTQTVQPPNPNPVPVPSVNDVMNSPNMTSAASNMGLANAQNAQNTPPPITQPAPSNGPNLANLLKVGMASSAFGPEAGNAVGSWLKPTDASLMAGQAGADPRQANIDALKKANYIAPSRLGEGAYYDPSKGVQGLPSQAQPGYINEQQNGQWATHPIGGGLQAVAQSVGTQEAAKEGNKIINTVVNGVSRPVFAGNVAGTAPAMGGQPAGQAPRIMPLIPSGQQTSKDPWETMPKMQMPSGVGQSVYQESMQKGAGETVSKLAEKFGTMADAANQRMTLNNQALELVDKADTGAFAAHQSEVKNILVKLGVPESDFTNTPDATIALQKDLVNAATAKAKQQFGARITQSEVNLMLSRGSPNVDMPKAAIQYLLNSDNKNAQYNIQQANDFGKYVQKGGDPYRFESWYSQTFPMTNAVSQVKLNTNPTPPPQANPQDIVNELRRRGLAK